MTWTQYGSFGAADASSDQRGHGVRMKRAGVIRTSTSDGSSGVENISAQSANAGIASHQNQVGTADPVHSLVGVNPLDEDFAGGGVENGDGYDHLPSGNGDVSSLAESTSGPMAVLAIANTFNVKQLFLGKRVPVELQLVVGTMGVQLFHVAAAGMNRLTSERNIC